VKRIFFSPCKGEDSDLEMEIVGTELEQNGRQNDQWFGFAHYQQSIIRLVISNPAA
jgi:hypothetical protein